MNLRSARKVLGVEEGADEKTIRRAYAKLAKQHRPDTDPERFATIRDAYDALLNDVQEEYFDELELPIAPDLTSSTGSTPLPPRHSSPEFYEDWGDGGQGYRDSEEPDEQSEHSDDAQDSDDDWADSTAWQDDESTHEPEPDINPLQSLEDEVVEAIKLVRPGRIETEDAVVLSADRYLSAATDLSHDMRRHVERFLFGACIGNYYVPHALRQRVAEYSGLVDSIVAEDKLAYWEQEFVQRFDESEVLEEFLQKAASRRNHLEHTMVHGARWDQVLMFRLDEKSVRTVNRWMSWTDAVVGEESGIIHPTVHKLWRQLDRVKPLTMPVMFFFVLLMMGSGVVLNAFGVPLESFFSFSTGAMIGMGALLGVLACANFMLVIFARPVLEAWVSRVREKLLSDFAAPTMVFELVVGLTLIGAWVFRDLLPAAGDSFSQVLGRAVVSAVGADVFVVTSADLNLVGSNGG